MQLPEGWWRCLLRPRATFELVKRQRRRIDRLQADLERRVHEGTWLRHEVADLRLELAWANSMVAAADAFMLATKNGADYEDAAAASARAYRETMWLEQTAQMPWVGRKNRWVRDQLDVTPGVSK